MTPAAPDVRLLRRIAAHYDGGLDLADALWWLERPDEPSPSGAVPPWAGLQQARALVYAPGAEPVDADRYRRLLALRDGELAAVRRALAAAQGESAVAGESPIASSPSPHPGAAPAAAAPARRRPLPVALLGAVPLAIALAFAVGLAVGGTLVSRPVAPATPEPAQTPTPVRVTRDGGALGVFVRPQMPEDVPYLPPGSDLIASTFRLLVPLPGPSVRLYAARTRGGDVCLVALAADEHIIASCSSVADFRNVPRSIDISVTKDPERLDGTDVRNEIDASWSYDGTVVAGAV